MERRKFMQQSLLGVGAFIPFANNLSPFEKKYLKKIQSHSNVIMDFMMALLKIWQGEILLSK